MINQKIEDDMVILLEAMKKVRVDLPLISFKSNFKGVSALKM